MFDAAKFSRAQFEPRTARVEVPDLAQWFGDEPPVFVVRGLTAFELARAADAEAKNKQLGSVVEVLSSVSQSEQVAALKDQLGLGDATHPEIAKRIEHLVMGSVEPVLTMDVAVKLATVYPAEFYQLTNQIIALTGKGQAEKKRGSSGGMLE